MVVRYRHEIGSKANICFDLCTYTTGDEKMTTDEINFATFEELEDRIVELYEKDHWVFPEPGEFHLLTQRLSTWITSMQEAEADNDIEF